MGIRIYIFLTFDFLTYDLSYRYLNAKKVLHIIGNFAVENLLDQYM